MKAFSGAKTIDQLAKLLGISPEAAERIKIRTTLINAIRKQVRRKRWSYAEVARRTKTGQATLRSILESGLARVPTDQLIDIAVRIGLRVSVSCSADTKRK